MEKRLPLALFLSFLVLFGWTILNPPKPPPLESEGSGEGPGGGADRALGAERDPGAPPQVGGDAPGEETPVAEAGQADGPVPEISDATERELELTFGAPGEPGHYRAVFSNRGGRLVSLSFGGFYKRTGLDAHERADPENWLPLLEPVETDAGTTGSLLLEALDSSRDLAGGPLGEALWTMERVDAAGGREPGVRFAYGPGTGVVFTKEITALPGTWNLRLVLGIENRGGVEPGQRNFLLRPGGCVPAELDDTFYREPRAVAVGWDEADGEYEIDGEDAHGADGPEPLKVPTPLVFAGAHNKYFAFFLREAEGTRATLVGASTRPFRPPVQPGSEVKRYVSTDVVLSLALPPEGSERRYAYEIYAGPKERRTLVGDSEAHALVLEDDLSTFASIGRGLLAIMGVFHGLTGNWGVAIILLTICVRAVLFPLNRRSQTAMARYQKKMKRVQPKLEDIKKRHANDPQKLREAQARIMQEEGAFPPLGGCLPILIQMPIFFGLFSALRTSFDLRQAPFAGWIDDLSRPDRLLELGVEIPLLITSFDLRYLNVLPLLMVVLWIWQQAGMPKPADEQAARMQKMMMFMPVVFCVLLYNYAAGLSLYMITQSGLGIVEQKVIKKLWPIDDTELAPKEKEKKGCGPFAGAMQNLAEKQKEQMKRMEQMKRQQAAQRSRSRSKRKRR